jgi:prepilin-type N-terminal cleavage/methylation domain-containing protein
MMLRFFADERGLTLVEIIMAIVIIGIISGVGAGMLAYYNGLGRKTYLVLQKQNELQTVINQILDGYGEKTGLITAKSFTLSGDADPCSMGDAAYKSILSFTIPDDTEFTYRYDEGDLYLEVTDAPDILVAEALTCFAAKNNGSNIVQLRIKSTVGGTGGERPVEIATQVKPRNVPAGD